MTDHPGRPTGYTTLTPFLVCSPAAAAIDFYRRVFGALEVSRMDGPDGLVLHAGPDFGEGRLQLSDHLADYGLVAPTGYQQDQVSASTCIYAPDVDAVFAAAVAAGATVREEPSTFVTGDRFASIYDPLRPSLGGHDPRRGRLARGGRTPARRVGASRASPDRRGPSNGCAPGSRRKRSDW